MTRYRVAYDHPEDGAGAVTRHDGQPLDADTAAKVAEQMRVRGDYDTVTVERQERPGSRWVS